MLDRAAGRFAGKRLIAVRKHDLADPLPGLAPADAIISALAIHHLSDQRKRTLFSEIHALLKPGGAFVNLDLVASPTPELHQRFRRAIGREQDDPSDLSPACVTNSTGWVRSPSSSSRTSTRC